MAQPARSYEHITLHPDGVARVAGTRARVLDLALSQRAHGMSPEELCFQFPHLTMGQIHAALAYYWDHKVELDQEMARRQDEVARLRSEIGPSPLVERLQATGRR